MEGTTRLTRLTRMSVWEGTWGNEQFPDFGTFSMEIEPTSGGFVGTMQIQRSTCVTNGP
jgi:hypothetical protein